MTLSDISRATDMTRATVRRFILTLVREGYAETDGKYFSLRPKVLELGFAALSSLSFVDVVQPILTSMACNLKESVFAAVFEKDHVVYVASAKAPDRALGMSVSVGSRAPAHSVSTGRILLAALPEEELLEYLDNAKITKLTPNSVTSKVKLRSLIEETRTKGWSIVDQGFEIGLRGMAVPIRNKSGQVIAALNVGCPTSRISYQEMNSTILLELQKASQTITENLQT